MIDAARLDALVAPLEAAVAAAGDAIMAVYAQADVGERSKADDSPVTLADLAAHRILADALADMTPEVPVLSEEGRHADAAERAAWSLCWIVDPLDGTREFLARNDQFTVNVALIHEQRPVLGCVGVPARAELFTGDVLQRRAERVDLASHQREPLRAGRFDARRRVRVLASRSHRSAELEALLAALRQRLPLLEEAQVGSALKLVELARGAADLYPRRGPCAEWDIAAGEAVLQAAGGAIFDLRGQPLRYNKATTLLNPDFYAVADAGADWGQWLAGLEDLGAPGVSGDPDGRNDQEGAGARG